MVQRKTNLDDDAFNKTTSLSALALTGMNVQINQHHPHGGHKGMLYSLKYSLKDEPTSLVETRHETDDLVQSYLNGQFILLFIPNSLRIPYKDIMYL